MSSVKVLTGFTGGKWFPVGVTKKKKSRNANSHDLVVLILLLNG